MSATDSGMPAADDNSAIRIVVEDDAVLMVGEDGEMEELTHFQRSETILNMLGAGDGTSILPITHFGIKLWQTAVDSMLNSEIWHLHRAVELSMVAHVAEYLNDQEVVVWAVKRLAQAVYSAVRGKYRQLYNQRNMADASFWRQMLRPQDISLTGTRFSKFAATERHMKQNSDSDPGMSDVDQYLVSSTQTLKNRYISPAVCYKLVITEKSNTSLLQALIDLPEILQIQVMSQVNLPLCVLVPQLPDSLTQMLLRSHLRHPQDLDISSQLRILESNTQYTRGMRDLVQKFPLSALAEDLHALCPLTRLNVSGNSLGQRDAAILCTVLSACITDLKSLTMCNNPQPTFASEVLPGVAKCTALTELDLTGCKLTEPCAGPLCAVLRATRSLQRLVLQDCIWMRVEDIEHAMAGLSSLTFLSLQDNRSRLKEGIMCVARVLCGLEALQEFDLSGNGPFACDDLACVVVAVLWLPALHTLKLNRLSVIMNSTFVSGQALLGSPQDLLMSISELWAVKAAGRHERGAGSGSGSGIGGSTASGQQESSNLYDDLENDQPPAFTRVSAPLRVLQLAGMSGMQVDWLMSQAATQFLWKSNRLRTVGSRFIAAKDAISAPNWQMIPWHLADDDLLQNYPAWMMSNELSSLELLDISSPEYSFKCPVASTPPHLTVECVWGLKSLKTLVARNLDVKWDSFTLRDLCEGFSRSVELQRVCGLTSLDWSLNSVTDLDLEAVCTLTSLQHLALQGCGLGVESAGVIAMHVTQLTNLRVLDLAANELKDIGVSMLLQAASKLEALRLLDVGRGSGVVQEVSVLRRDGCIADNLTVQCTGVLPTEQ